MSQSTDPDGYPDEFFVPGPVLALIFFAAGVMFVAGWLENVPHWGDGGTRAEGYQTFGIIASVWLATAGILLWVLSTSRGEPRRRRPATAKPRFPLCANCMKPHVDGAHFCPVCARPLTFFAATAGYEEIHARAWAVGKAANHPSRPIHVWGLTVVAVATVLLWLAYLYGILTGMEESAGYGGGAVDVLLTLAALAGAMLHTFIWIALAVRSRVRWRLLHTNPDLLPPESSYASPPWWTYDVEWAAPGVETSAAGSPLRDPPPESQTT